MLFPLPNSWTIFLYLFCLTRSVETKCECSCVEVIIRFISIKLLGKLVKQCQVKEERIMSKGGKKKQRKKERERERERERRREKENGKMFTKNYSNLRNIHVISREA